MLLTPVGCWPQPAAVDGSSCWTCEQWSRPTVGRWMPSSAVVWCPSSPAWLMHILCKVEMSTQFQPLWAGLHWQWYSLLELHRVLHFLKQCNDFLWAFFSVIRSENIKCAGLCFNLDRICYHTDTYISGSGSFFGCLLSCCMFFKRWSRNIVCLLSVKWHKVVFFFHSICVVSMICTAIRLRDPGWSVVWGVNLIVVSCYCCCCCCEYRERPVLGKTEAWTATALPGLANARVSKGCKWCVLLCPW